ncbi:MAG: exopolyphosphatase, partial [Kiritimatiellia bacterium]|nr:exopolyphosphatase [Kiritimatiellia bacterium]
MRKKVSQTAGRPTKVPASDPDSKSRLIAVIDIGARSVRLEISEIGSGGKIRILDSLSRPVALGKDTFGEGRIRRETTEDVVRVLRSFKSVLAEYGLTDPASVRAVATSAVREAQNREAFLDRIFLATGLTLVCLDEVEMS